MILAQANAVVEAAPAPSLATTLLVIFISASLTDNILLTRFLGMCPFMAISRQLKSAVGLGVAVTFVTTCTAGLNALVYKYLIVGLGLPPSMQLILFIVMIAAFTQLMEMLIERLSLGLYYALGVFLPLITVNCAILGTSLFMVNRGYHGVEAVVFGFGSGLGWMIAIVLMAGIRERLKKAKIPPGLEGPGITCIIAGLMAMAFIIFSGMIKQ
jgi:Na+-transporting NADH:ubiquinone oxidoreductase subunit E